MNIDEAARATRGFYIEWNGLKDAQVWQVFTSEHVAASRGFNSRDDAQAACDRLNLIAVLEAIREPSDSSLAYVAPEEDAAKAHWINMIDALIAEVKAQK